MNWNWLRAAMSDDNLVAEFLLRLNRPDSLPPRRAKPSPPLPPLDWGIRQPRSMAAASLNKEQDARRHSPTTPLSWTASGFGSAAASPSNSCEESSVLLVSAAKFQGSATTDISNSVSASKTSRKKRTYVELKEEESSLSKEKDHLNKQMESLHMKLEEKRSSNENLKRIKLDLHAHSATVKENIREPPVFVLPDLNMMPGEDCNSESLVGMS